MSILTGWLASTLGALACVQGGATFISPRLDWFTSRKVMHIVTAIFFLMTWPLYPDNSLPAACAAASVVAAATAQFVLIGLGYIKNKRLVNAVAGDLTRTKELLKGPVQYGAIVTALTVFRFRRPAAAIVVGALCGGDGLAAIVGFHCGSNRVPWNQGKTVEGMIAFVLGTAAAGSGLLLFFATYLGDADDKDVDWLGQRSFLCVGLCAVLGALVESWQPPWGNVDNVTVPATCVLLTKALAV